MSDRSKPPLVPYPPPPLELNRPVKDTQETTNFWREAMSMFARWTTDRIKTLMDNDEVVTQDVLALAPRYALSSGGTQSFAPAVNHDDGMLAWTSYINSRYTAVFATRGTDNRWRHVANLPLDSTTAGQSLVEINNPNGTGHVISIVYVPHKTGGGDGLGHGKFWLFCSVTNKVRVVEPSDLSYTDYSIGDAVLNAATWNASARYSADQDRVYCIMGGKTRLVAIDPADVTLDKELATFTDIRSIDLQTDSGVTSRVWVAEYTTGVNTLYYCDAADVSAGKTSSGANVTQLPFPIIYLPDVGEVFLGQYTGVNLFSVNATTFAIQTMQASGNLTTNRFAYLSEIHGIAVLCGDLDVFDSRFIKPSSGNIGAMVAKILDSGWITGLKHDCFWDPTYRELYICSGVRDELWVCY